MSALEKLELEGFMSSALQCCMDITNDYSEEEVKKYAPPSVQNAWNVGNEFIELQIKTSKKNRKKFII